MLVVLYYMYTKNVLIYAKLTYVKITSIDTVLPTTCVLTGDINEYLYGILSVWYERGGMDLYP